MKKYSLIIGLNLLLLLVYFNYSILGKETLLQEGRLVFLELAPVDPRSLMQGDYMSLRYKISEEFNLDKNPRRGFCVVQFDGHGVASKARFQSGPTPLKKGEQLIRYTSPDRWNVHIGAESFFFQEGEAKKYEAAKYGGVRVDREGNSLLVGLYDEHLKKIE